MKLTMIDLDMVAKIATIVNDAAAKISDITGNSTNLLVCDKPPMRKYVTDEVKAKVIIEQAAEAFGITAIELISKSRKTPLPDARGVAIIGMKKHTKLSLGGIGKQIGGRDHSTVLTRIKTVKNVALYEKELRQKIETVLQQLENLNIYDESRTNTTVESWVVFHVDSYWYKSGRNYDTYVEVTFWVNESGERKETTRQETILSGSTSELPDWAKCIDRHNRQLDNF